MNKIKSQAGKGKKSFGLCVGGVGVLLMPLYLQYFSLFFSPRVIGSEA